MSAPTWLPPLNSHEVYVTAMSIQEADDILDTVPVNVTTVSIQEDHYIVDTKSVKEIIISIQEGNCIPDIPQLAIEDMFIIDIMVAVNFFVKKSNKGFPGLRLRHKFIVPSRAVDNCRLFTKIVDIMVTHMQVPFQLDPIYIQESNHHLYLYHGHGSIHKVLDSLHSMRSKSFSNIIPLRWKIVKGVGISNHEYDAWTSWYVEKIRIDPNFKNQYIAAISRPRTIEELSYEQMVQFSAATASSIKALLEDVKIEDSDYTGNCLICLEDFSAGCKAARLPCSHVFHRDCIVQWLRESHICPLCRFKLPTYAED